MMFNAKIKIIKNFNWEEFNYEKEFNNYEEFVKKISEINKEEKNLFDQIWYVFNDKYKSLFWDLYEKENNIKDEAKKTINKINTDQIKDDVKLIVKFITDDIVKPTTKNVKKTIEELKEKDINETLNAIENKMSEVKELVNKVKNRYIIKEK